MPSYVAFLRAINLGAKRKFGKDDICRATEAAGFTDVATHINTGNVRVTTSLRSRRKVEAALEAAYLADRGFEVPTIAFSVADLRGVLADAEELATSLGYDGGPHYVSLLKNEPDAETIARVEASPSGTERAFVRGRAVHMLYPDGYGTARFTNAQVERALGVATNRNLTVVRAVVTKWC